MTRRAVTTILWFFASSIATGPLSVYAGLPSFIGLALGLAVATLVWWDPRGWLWKPAPDRAAMRRRIAELERVPDQAPAGEMRHETGSAPG